MSDDASQRLDELKLLWESDPSSKVYLQLASAYRQKGQLDKAVEVLETSLQHRPRDPRGRVALARCRIEMNDHAAAAELLEEVIRQDAAHVEANKQLLECYLRIGDVEKAEERLGIYKLLNDRDPELDHLEYRLTSLRDGDGEAEPVAAAISAPVPVETVPIPPIQSTAEPPPARPSTAPERTIEPGVGVAAEPDLQVSRQATAFEQIPDTTPTVPAVQAEPEPPAPAPESESAEDQVPATTEPPAFSEETSEEASAVDSSAPAPDPELASAEPASVEPASAETLSAEPEAAPEEPELEAEPESEALSPDDAEPEAPALAVENHSSDADLFDLAPVEEPENDDPWGGDLFELAAPASESDAAESDLDGLWEQTEIVALDDEDDDEGEREAEEPEIAATTSEDAASASLASEEAGPAGTAFGDSDTEDSGAAEAEPETPAATATLGLLYLKQGHLDEAESIFRRVLSKDSENEAALAGLQQLDTQRLAMQADDDPAEEVDAGLEPDLESGLEIEFESEPELRAEPEIESEPELEPEAVEETEAAVAPTEPDVAAAADPDPDPQLEAEAPSTDPEPLSGAQASVAAEIEFGEPEPVSETELAEPTEPELVDDEVEEPEPVAADSDSTADSTPELVSEPRSEPAATVEDSPAAEPALVAEPELAEDEAPPALTGQALLARAALEGGLPGDEAGRKIAVLKQYIQQIRTASADHVH